MTSGIRRYGVLEMMPSRQPPSAPTRAAERQRRHRERRRAGIFVVPVRVAGEMLEALIKRGDVDEADARDLDCVGEAIAAAARRGLDLT